MACVPCVIGSFSDQYGQNACKWCAPGTYTSVVGSASCLPCPPGFYAPSTGSFMCFACAKGTDSQAGAAFCSPSSSEDAGDGPHDAAPPSDAGAKRDASPHDDDDASAPPDEGGGGLGVELEGGFYGIEGGALPVSVAEDAGTPAGAGRTEDPAQYSAGETASCSFHLGDPGGAATGLAFMGLLALRVARRRRR